MSTVNRIERKKAVLEQILGTEKAMQLFSEADNENQFNVYADTTFLKHVLKNTQVRLSDVSSRSHRSELDNWDRRHLVDLADRIKTYVNEDSNLEKIRYLISHSIQENLVGKLLSGSQSDKFARYNRSVVSRIEDQGINLSAWLNHGENLSFAQSYNPRNPFTLQTKQWSRDFRREFGIGNVSECCIAVDSVEDKQQYKKVLLDYFLDLSMQVILINQFDSDGSIDWVGQAYFVAANCEGKYQGKKKKVLAEPFGPCMGVTSIEIAQRHKQDTDLVPSIVTATEHYADLYGFKSVIYGLRFNMMDSYFSERKKDFGNMISLLKGRRQQVRDRKRTAVQNDMPVQNYNEQLNTLDSEIDYLQTIKKGQYVVSKVKMRKSGITNCLQEKNIEYFGTDYIDMFAPNREGADGFFQPNSARGQDARGFLVYGHEDFAKLENMLGTLRQKYIKKFKK